MASTNEERRNKESIPPAQASKRLAKKLCLSQPNFRSPSEMVEFVVGSGDIMETFTVHKEFACCYSPVLNAAFNGPFVEGQTHSYPLPDICPGAFRLLLHWFYSQHFDASSENYMDVDPNRYVQLGFVHVDKEEYDNHYVAKAIAEFYLVQLWVTADQLLMPRLQNAAMQKLIQMNLPSKGQISIHWLKYAYKHSMSGSVLRQMIADHFAFVSNWSARAEMEITPLELLYDVIDTINDNTDDIVDEEYEEFEEWVENGNATTVANVAGGRANKVTAKRKGIFRTITYNIEKK